MVFDELQKPFRPSGALILPLDFPSLVIFPFLFSVLGKKMLPFVDFLLSFSVLLLSKSVSLLGKSCAPFSKSSSLCPECKSIFSLPHSITDSATREYTKTVTRTARTSGCRLCALLAHRFFSDKPGQQPPQRKSESVELTFWLQDGLRAGHDAYCLHFEDCDPQTQSQPLNLLFLSTEGSAIWAATLSW